MEYEWTEPTKADGSPGKLVPRLPLLAGLHYESAVGYALCMLFDAHRRRVGCADVAQPSSALAVRPGERHVIRIQLRHERVEVRRTRMHIRIRRLNARARALSRRGT